MSDKNLTELYEQSYREGTQDGVNALFGGMMFFCASLMFWSAFVQRQISPIMLLPAPLLIFLSIPLTKQLRERYTYPRTGYVQYRGPERSLLAAIVLPMLFGFIITVVLLVLWYGTSFNLEVLYRFMPLYIGLAMIPPSILLVRRTGTPIHSLQGLLMSITGLAFVIPDFGDSGLGMVFYLLLWSGVTILVGLLKLFRFIKKYPVLEVPEGDAPEQRKSHFY